MPPTGTDISQVSKRLHGCKPLTKEVVHHVGGKTEPLRAHPDGVVHEDLKRVDLLKAALVLVQVCASASIAASLELACAIGVGLERSSTGIAAAE